MRLKGRVLLTYRNLRVLYERTPLQIRGLWLRVQGFRASAALRLWASVTPGFGV